MVQHNVCLPKPQPCAVHARPAGDLLVSLATIRVHMRHSLCAHEPSCKVHAGTRVMQHNVRLLKPQPCVMHARPAGDLLVSLAAPEPFSSVPGQHGRGAQLLAACSMRAVVLLDLRRPSEPLLLWHHRALSACTALLSAGLQK